MLFPVPPALDSVDPPPQAPQALGDVRAAQLQEERLSLSEYHIHQNTFSSHVVSCSYTRVVHYGLSVGYL